MAAIEEPMVPMDISKAKVSEKEMDEYEAEREWEREQSEKKDFYSQLKAWQRQLEFLEIQVCHSSLYFIGSTMGRSYYVNYIQHAKGCHPK